MDFVLIAAGLIALYFGAEWLLKGAVSIARKSGMPTLLVSLVVVGFGTSMPELLVSVRAAISGSPDIALGNVVGSNIANILLIIGVGAIIYPMHKWDRNASRDALFMVAVSVLTLALVHFEVIGRLAGAFMVTLLALYLTWSYFEGKKATVVVLPEELAEPIEPTKLALVQVLGGLIVLFAGAEMLVRGATALARDFGISETVIGLTIVAVGTSLPELATSAIAALRKHPDIAIGNVIGSNIFNILGILGATVLISPVGVDPQFATFDVPIMLATAIGFAALLFIGKPIGRVIGILLVGSYAAYIGSLF